MPRWFYVIVGGVLLGFCVVCGWVTFYYASNDVGNVSFVQSATKYQGNEMRSNFVPVFKNTYSTREVDIYLNGVWLGKCKLEKNETTACDTHYLLTQGIYHLAVKFQVKKDSVPTMQTVESDVVWQPEVEVVIKPETTDSIVESLPNILIVLGVILLGFVAFVFLVWLAITLNALIASHRHLTAPRVKTVGIDKMGKPIEKEYPRGKTQIITGKGGEIVDETKHFSDEMDNLGKSQITGRTYH